MMTGGGKYDEECTFRILIVSLIKRTHERNESISDIDLFNQRSFRIHSASDKQLTIPPGEETAWQRYGLLANSCERIATDSASRISLLHRTIRAQYAQNILFADVISRFVTANIQAINEIDH